MPTVTIRGRKITLTADRKNINNHDPHWCEVMFEINRENLARVREQNAERRSRAA